MDVTRRELLLNPRIVQVRQVVHGIVEVEVVVVHPVHETLEIVDPRERIAAFDHVRIAEQRVGGVVRAQRRAHRGDGDAGRLAIGVDERDDFVADVLVEHPLAPAAVERMRAAVQIRLVVVRTHAVHLDAAGIDELPQRVGHTVALQLPLVAVTRRKRQQRWAPMPENRHTHVVLEPRRIPDAMIGAQFSLVPWHLRHPGLAPLAPWFSFAFCLLPFPFSLYFFPTPQTARPGFAPVCSPSFNTCTPLTNTCRMPTAYWCGFSKVARSEI